MSLYPKLKLNKFLITTMISYTLYLGYTNSQLHTKMAFYLLGPRLNVSIHKLSLTYLAVRSVVAICTQLWKSYSMLWLVSPKNPYIGYLMESLSKAEKLMIKKNLLFWLNRWLPGFFNNTLGFVKVKKKMKYPAALFYTQYTGNIDRIQEAYLRNILHFNLVDTNSPVAGEYPINSNEITKLSNIYYSKLLLNTCLQVKGIIKKDFII